MKGGTGAEEEPGPLTEYMNSGSGNTVWNGMLGFIYQYHENENATS